MRLYTLKCSKCNYVFDKEMSLMEYVEFTGSTSGLQYRCPKCNVVMTPRRIITHPTAVIYKTDGFYSKDSKKE